MMVSSTKKGQKRKSMESTVGECVLCHKECDEDRSNTGLEAWANLKHHAQQWQGLDQFGMVFDEVIWEDGPQSIYYHKSCKIQLFSSSRLQLAMNRKQKETIRHKQDSQLQSSSTQVQEQSADLEGPIQRQSRSQTGFIHDKNLCIWCMKPEDLKHPGRDKWHTMEQMQAWYAFKCHTVHLEDQAMRKRLLTFIESTSDPFAVEIRYHRSCWRKYVSSHTQTGSDDPMLHLQHVQLSEAREIFFKHVRHVVLEDHELRTLQSLLQDYIRILSNFGMNSSIVKSSTLKNLIQTEFKDRIGFHDRYQKNLSTLVYDTSAGGSYIEAAINCWGISDEQIIKTAAKRIKAQVSKLPPMPWPIHVDELIQDENFEDLLLTFVMLLKNPSIDKSNQAIHDPEAMALASLLSSYMTKTRTPFKVKLTVMLHGLTRSREIVDIMKKFALGISYRDVLNLYDAWAKYDIEHNKTCPDELAVGIPGTAVMDNDDFKDDTLTGANTSHRTNVMFVQPEDLINVNPDVPPVLDIPTAQTMKRLCESQHVVQPYKTVQRGTPDLRPEADIAPSCDTAVQRIRGLIHTLLRLDENQLQRAIDEQQVGAFAGFQASIQPTVIKSKPYYFLTFPSPPNKAVVHEVMERMVAAATTKSMPFIQLVGDQPVYTLIVQIRYEHPDQFSLILPSMGPFHIHCSFIYAMHKRFQGSGLSDILVTAGAIAEGSVDHALRGKHYKRSIRCLRLMYEALIRRLIENSLQNGAAISGAIRADLQILQDASLSQQERLNSFERLQSNPAIVDVVQEEVQRIKSSGSPMARYWMSFLEMTEILMMNLHALRTRNWDEFKGSLRLMLPWMQIYDNNKYGKWMAEYWLEITNLPDEKAAYMREGLFAQSMTGKPYSCLPLDLWIEMTMNKGSKMKAGWLRILKNEKMLLTDSRTVNCVNRLRSSMHAIANSTKSKHQHSENTKTRRKQDEQVVQDIGSCITEFECDPFSLENPKLRSLQSGVLASSALVDDFESAHTDGENMFQIFCNDRMLSNNVPFYSTVRKNCRRNFSNPPPVRNEPNDKVTKSEAMENKAMASIISLAEAHDDTFNLVDVMDYRVTEECLPIFNINGTMRKTQKSKLVEKLNMQTIDPVPSEYVAILDMGFIWHLSTPSLEDRQQSDGTNFTWRDFAAKMFSIIMSRHKYASKIILVNDRYDLPYSIKDSERKVRSNSSPGSKNVFIRALDKFPSASSYQDLLHNSANKQRLQTFLRDEFTLLCRAYPNIQFVYSVGQLCYNLPEMNRVVDYECEQTEADTIIFFIYSKIRSSGCQTAVVIDAEDTDIIVLAAYVANTVDGILAIKRKQIIVDCQKLCSKEIADIIVPLHVYSGCDTTSAFFGHGKVKIYEKATSSDEARALLALIGKEFPVPQNTLDDLATFTIRYIYNDKVSKTLGEARARKWTQMKRKSTLRLPPDQESHDLNIHRVNYQTFVYLHFASPELHTSPLSCGWTLENGFCIPLRHTHPALPRYLSEVEQRQQNRATEGYDSTDSGQSESDSDSIDHDNDIDYE